MSKNPTEHELFEIRVQAALVAIGSVLRATIPLTERVRIHRQIERSTTYVPEGVDQDERLRAYYIPNSLPSLTTCLASPESMIHHPFKAVWLKLVIIPLAKAT